MNSRYHNDIFMKKNRIRNALTILFDFPPDLFYEVVSLFEHFSGSHLRGGPKLAIIGLLPLVECITKNP